MNMLRNKIQLITYADSLGKDLPETLEVLKSLRAYVGGVHVLPFYPSSGDRGFAPLTHLEVDEKFGDWGDIEDIAHEFDLVVDLVANHISRQSEYFRDFVKHGRESEYFDMFLPHLKFDPFGKLDPEVLSLVYTARPKPPYQDVETHGGETLRVWQTFSDEQIDLDLRSRIVRDLIARYVRGLATHGVKMIRLDAIGYVIKKLGTDSFFVEPEIYEFLDFVADICASNDIALLAEIHKNHEIQLKIASQGHWVYDFCLPMLVLHALYTGNACYLFDWLQICPHNQITVLDTHDGIGVVDVEGILPEEQIELTSKRIFENGGNALKRAFGKNSENLDVYQINSTFYSALEEDDEAYLLARAIQFFTPGIPQVYYVGLLAGSNDIELLEKTGQGRDINRHNYTPAEVEQELQRPVVQRLLKLIDFRNKHGAFGGDMEMVPSSGGSVLEINWKTEQKYANLKANLATKTFRIHYSDDCGAHWRELDLSAE